MSNLILLPDPQVPPDLPGIGEHLPDILELDSAEGLASGEVKLHGHFDELGSALVGKCQKLDVESKAVDLAQRSDLSYQIASVDLDAGLGIVALKSEKDLEHYVVADREYLSCEGVFEL